MVTEFDQFLSDELGMRFEGAGNWADATRFAAQHEFGVGEGEAVRMRLHGRSVQGIGLQFGQRVGEPAFVEVGGGVHGIFLRSCVPERQKRWKNRQKMPSAHHRKALPAMKEIVILHFSA